MLYYTLKGQHQKECDDLWEKLVPQSGQADTIQGELIRAIVKLENECFRNGNCNWDAGFRTLTSFLLKHLSDKSVFDAAALGQIASDIEDIRGYGNGKRYLDYTNEGEDAFDRVIERVLDWCRAQPELLKHEHNPKLKR